MDWQDIVVRLTQAEIIVIGLQLGIVFIVMMILIVMAIFFE
jgi:hypothetical protein